MSNFQNVEPTDVANPFPFFSTLRLAPVIPRAKPDHFPWVTVVFAGTDQEEFFSEHASYEKAREVQAEAQCVGVDLDVMLRRTNGQLTTEY